MDARGLKNRVTKIVQMLDTFFPLCYNTWQSNEGNDSLCSDFTTGRGVMDCERLAEAVNRRTFRS